MIDIFYNCCHQFLRKRKCKFLEESYENFYDVLFDEN